MAEWTEDKIKVSVSPRRINEAFAFRLWIKSNLEATGSNIFYDANLAAEAGDFEKAKELLDKAIGDLTESADPERDAIVAIARSKREMLVAREEIIKRRANRDLRKIAWACLRAGKASHLPAETTSTQSDILSSRRYLALSDALKWRAVNSLIQQALSNDARQKSLEDAERFLCRAANYARTALSRSRGDELPVTHASLLAYSHLTVRERLALMRFMITGEDQYFNTAMGAWAGALEIANKLSETEKASLFPHRFYSLKDLELEELFLNAARAFRNAHWSDCVALLQDWINNFPIEYRWTWRYSNVKVRLLGASVIANICLPSGQFDRAALGQQIRDLSAFAGTEPIGKAGRYFADEILRLPAKSAYDIKNAILHHLCPYFTLDSHVDFYDPPTEIDPFESLPSRIARGLSQPTAITRTQFELAKVEFFASIEALLGYVCDYDAQWLPTAQPLPEPSIRAFLQFCEQFGWAQKPQGERLLNQLDAVVAHCEAATTADEFTTLYEQGRQIVRRLLKLVPLTVSLKARLIGAEQQDYTHASPDWCLDRSERESIRISVKSQALLPIEPGEYYLTPPWRTGTRLFYLVDPDDNNPLFSVRFKPRWDYWDRTLQKLNVVFWLPGGVKYAHLERAVELAAKSVPDDEKPSPKVGALIVKDGEVIAEAFRNEYGKTANMHAEETALEKCNKCDLTGAIAITTLEPCVTGRRHSKTTCANLLLQAGIKHVIIGMLDPDSRIRGKAEGLFRKNGVSIYYFPTELRTALGKLNTEFIEEKEKYQFRTIYHYNNS
ncbi:MAG: deaminase [Pyrinomonadaceae bacterium]